MSTLLLHLHGPNSAQVAPIAVEVINAELEVIAEHAISSIKIQEISVEPGKYLVRAKLPSGEVITRQVSITQPDGVKEVILKTPETPNEWLEWQYFLGNTTSSKSNIHLSNFPLTWLRLWTHDYTWGEWLVQPLPLNGSPQRNKEVVKYSLHKFGVRQLSFLQLGGEQVPWRFVALPPEDMLIGTGLEVLIHPSNGREDLGATLSVAVVSHDEKAETLLAYLTSGKLEATKIIGDEILDEVREFPKDNFRTSSSIVTLDSSGHPVGAVRATIAGYYLLKFKAFDRLHNWVKDFADNFEWLPDAEVIRAWQLLSSRTKSKECVYEARCRLLQAASQSSPPAYTYGLRLLFDGLQMFKQEEAHREQDEALDSALKRVRAYAAAADWFQPLTTFYGETPGLPALSARTGIPEDTTNLVWV